MIRKETNNVLDEDICQRMAEIIHQITNKQYKLINDETVKQLQNLCSDNNDYIERAYNLLFDNLKKRHSEVRYNTFYIMNVLFKNYHSFRLLTVEGLKSILDLTVEINYDDRLPPPKAAANELKRLALKSIKEWVQMFGTTYKKLILCYDFLRRKKKVDFDKLEVEDQALKKRKEEEQRRKQMINEERLRLLRNSMKDMIPEINGVRESLLSCLNLLIPSPEQFFIREVANENESETFLELINVDKIPNNPADDTITQEVDENEAVYRESGMLKGTFSIDINLPRDTECIKIIENEENAIIIENAKDHYKLLSNKYLNTVKNWIKALTTLSESTSELKKIIDFKAELEKVIRKYQSLVFLEDQDDCDSDSDMVEVTPQVPSADEAIIASLKDLNSMPSTSGVRFPLNSQSTRSSNDQKEPKEQNDRKKKLLEIAPKLPFDIDLYHWEEENLSAPMLLPVTAEGRQFWSATAIDDTDGGIPDPEGVAGLRTRIIEFTGKFEPVKWSCRFPLPNGKLCPRKDRCKCPFHGTIVPRDETGKCANLEDEKKQRETIANANYMDAQNPELLAEIHRATGINLKLHDGKRRKKTDENGLTDIKKEENTVYKRLEKKIFNKSSVKKVARTLDNLDRKRFRDKFGDQFQYVHGTIRDT